MEISSIISGFTGQSLASQSAQQGATNPATSALKKAGNRIEQQIGTTQVKLSAFGQIKGAFAELQTAASTLADSKQTATADNLKKAVGGFVAAYNKTNKALAAATQAEGKNAPGGALSADSRARIAGNELQRSLADGSTLSDLKNVGITQNQDGSLSLDAKALDSALNASPVLVRYTVASVGAKVERTAANELANTGNVGASVTALSKRNAALSTQQAIQQTTQQDQQIATQRQLDKQSAAINNVFASGLAAYQRTFTA